MPKLIKDGAVQNDDGQQLLGRDDWLASDGSQGLKLAVDDEPDEQMLRAPLIAIEFPAFNDGRGLSLCVLLRERLGYSGDLRAIGDVHHELAHYLVRCGFSSMLLPDERDVEVALQGANVYSGYYQGSVADPTPLFRR